MAQKKSKNATIDGKALFKLRIPTAISISPDESKIAYTVERMDEKENKYFSNIYLHDLKTKQTTQFTHGNQNDGTPVWSPDGTQIAFSSTRDKITALYIMPTEGGAEKKIFEYDGALANLNWTPDGQSFVFSLRYNDSHFIKDEKKKKQAPVFRHITRLFYRLDGAGFMPQDRFQIYRYDIENGQLNQLTKGKFDNLFGSVSKDGKLITYVSNRQKNPDLDSLCQDLFVMPLKGGKEKKIITPVGPVSEPRFSPDGHSIAYIGHDNPNDDWGTTNQHVWKVGLTGKPKARDLTPTFDRMAYDQSIGDTGDVHGPAPLFWSSDSKRIYFCSSDTGATNIFYVPARGGKPTRIFDGKCHIKGFSMNGKTRIVASVYADLENPGEIVISPATYGGEKKTKKLTELNSFLKKEITLGKTKEVWFKSFDGTKIQGWMVFPPNFNPNKKYPSVLEIHGGPRTQYAFTFFHEMQYLAAKGYVVFYTNPRGGSGRGKLWAAAISGGWGDLDYKDCMAAADYMENQKFIHPKKMGVTGGSYGGYMTNWIIGQTQRFKAAVTQRSICDLKSFIGSSDIGYELGREFNGFHWNNPENYDKCSPITYFKKVKTPVLIIHSEQDLRCPTEQAEQMFAMLKLLKKTVELVRFPEEPHGLSRHGRPDRRIARLAWIEKWFAKYLK